MTGDLFQNALTWDHYWNGDEHSWHLQLDGKDEGHVIRSAGADTGRWIVQWWLVTSWNDDGAGDEETLLSAQVDGRSFAKVDDAKRFAIDHFNRTGATS